MVIICIAVVLEALIMNEFLVENVERERERPGGNGVCSFKPQMFEGPLCIWQWAEVRPTGREKPEKVAEVIEDDGRASERTRNILVVKGRELSGKQANEQ